jgi:hypothetical protein
MSAADHARKRAFTVVFVTTEPGAIRRLRALLKTAKRRDALTCTNTREISPAKFSHSRSAPVVGCEQARREVKTMDMRKYSGSGFLKVPDIAASGPRQVTIVDVSEGKFGKPDVEFGDGSKLGLNATNNRTLVTAYGTDSDDWINKQVELVVGEVEYQGTPKACILIKPISRPIAKKAPAPEPNLDDQIPF